MMLLWQLLLLCCLLNCLAEQQREDFGPIFLEEPQDTLYAAEGISQNITLHCKAKGNPHPVYRWLVNGTAVSVGSHQFLQHGGNLLLNLLSKKREVMTVQCLARNAYGSVLSRKALLQPQYLDQFSNQPRKAIRAALHRGVRLHCYPPQYSPSEAILQFRWLFNSFPMLVTVDERRFVSQLSGDLYIASTEPQDSGRYACLVGAVINKSNKLVFSQFAPLDLHKDGRSGSFPPRMALVPQEMTFALVNRSIRLECFAKGNPVPQVSWRRVQGEIPATAQILAFGAVIFFPVVQKSDEGVYKCEAQNPLGNAVAQSHLIVHEALTWTKELSRMELDIGDELHWDCKASGNPTPSYSWLKNGESLISTDKLHLGPQGELHIFFVELSDSGMYQCLTRNANGSLSSSAELRVRTYEPYFHMSRKERVVVAVEWGEAQIPCKPRASPPAEITWSRPGIPLDLSSKRVQVLSDGMLSIQNLKQDDAGPYTCLAENVKGKSSLTFHLAIKRATWMAKPPKDILVNVSKRAVFQCRADADPTLNVTYSWLMRGQSIDFTSTENHFTLNKKGKGDGDLTIHDVRLSDAGKYTCITRTDVDNISASAQLIVRGPPGPPRAPQVTDVTEHMVMLSWKPGSSNHSPIRKYTVQHRTLHSHQWKRAITAVPSKVLGSMHTAVVEGLIPWMNYEFRIIAANDHGRGEPSKASYRIRTKAAPPVSVPSHVGRGGGELHQLVITWTPIPKELHYGEGFGYTVAFRPQQSTEDWTQVIVDDAQKSYYTISHPSIPPYTPYSVHVGTFNILGEGPDSNETIIFSGEAEPTAAPSVVGATSLSAFTAAVCWMPIHPATVRGVLLGYRIQYWIADWNDTQLVLTSANETSKELSGLLPSTTYIVEIRAYNSAGFGPPSDLINVTTLKPPPRQVRGVTALVWPTTGVQLRWRPVMSFQNESSLIGYKVPRGDSS
uniref:Contactin 3a, tandem duplicate 2 n=1 Tax=Eptatretus burgeri TaxID=7764 RepID=A0A8C4QQ90_EPTBU